MDIMGSGQGNPGPPPDLARGAGRMQALLLSAAAACASKVRGASFLILIFHRVLPEWDPLLPGEPSRASFAAQMDLVSSFLRVLPLSEAVAMAARGTLPPRAACITFDDGYANNLEVAAPLLSSRGLPATVFVATSFLEGGNMWNDSVIESVRRAPGELDLSELALPRFVLNSIDDRRAAIATLLESLKYLEPAERTARVEAIVARVGGGAGGRLMLTADGVRRLAASGIEVGAHTRNHPILTRISDETAAEEISGSRRILQDITGRSVAGFAYPNGRPARDYARRHVELVRAAGFEYAVSTAWGSASARSDRYQLPRVAAWDRTPLRYGARLVRAYAERGGSAV